MKKSLLDYMSRTYFSLEITIASLALSIYRLKYYDSKNWPIHIPNKNEDSFLRRGYYGVIQIHTSHMARTYTTTM
ncbi:hypothetical protein IEQ34_023940 [Dendrobium chrysotoxum]|uniref:DNA-directed DNA polymerase n=1 Tax=Dendrobium chrysotoxum TaxID=161865 RepID=A0AAV7FUX5_DENCH|nr:hypothetical protein IEQ34_023940 [Dendrobium chrysotoxum]